MAPEEERANLLGNLARGKFSRGSECILALLQTGAIRKIRDFVG